VLDLLEHGLDRGRGPHGGRGPSPSCVPEGRLRGSPGRKSRAALRCARPAGESLPPVQAPGRAERPFCNEPRHVHSSHPRELGVIGTAAAGTRPPPRRRTGRRPQSSAGRCDEGGAATGDEGRRHETFHVRLGWLSQLDPPGPSQMRIEVGPGQATPKTVAARRTAAVSRKSPGPLSMRQNTK
jgi:hypothetical protein